MVRALIIFIVAAVGALLVALLVDNPGQVTVDWLGYRLETAMSLMAVMLAVVFLMAMVALHLIKIVLGGPAAWRRFFGKVRARQGMGALTQGLAAAAAGDASQARRHAITAERLAKEGPLAQVLALEAAELEGRTQDVALLASGLLEQPETALLGRRALFDLARKANNEEAAVDEAEAAFEKHPAAGWAAEALLADAIDAGDWPRAKSIYARAARLEGFTNGRASRVSAALKQAEANHLFGEDHAHKALALAKKAHEADLTFAPAPILIAEIYGQDGKVKRAQKTVEDAWSSLPHPMLGRIYAELFPGERQVETLGRLRGLINLNAGHTESRLLFALYAIAARNFMAGRDALKDLVQGEGSARAYAAMAMLDRAEQGMAEASAEWMTKALAAPRDAVWVCTSCGHSHGNWSAVCGRCRSVGTQEWATHIASVASKTPYEPARANDVEVGGNNGVEQAPKAPGLSLPELETAKADGDESEPIPGQIPERIEGPGVGEEAAPTPFEATPTPFEEGVLQPDDPGTDKNDKGKGETVW